MSAIYTENRNTVNIPSMHDIIFDLNILKIDKEDAVEHYHDDLYEIYLNLSGGVSFAVGDTVYPLKPGSVILSRPNERHHIVYNLNTTHHCILLYLYTLNNERFYESVFKNADTYTILSDKQFFMFNKLCNILKTPSLPHFQKLNCFLDLLNIFYKEDYLESKEHNKNYPDVTLALEYISKHLNTPLSIQKIAKYANVSTNTLERHFKSSMNISPYTYITRRRLSKAAILLQQNNSVTYAALESGFTDCSHFSSLFKSYYNLTPREYKQAALKKGN